MSRIKAGTEHQQEILKILKSKYFQELLLITDTELNECISSDYYSFVSIEKIIVSDREIQIRVTVEGDPSVRAPEEIEKLFPPDIFVERSWSTDGFSMMKDGTILEFHPEEYDDD